jgi:D-alanine-D-alanine ligase
MKITVVAGGRTPERDVSLRSGHRVTTSLSELGHDVELVDPGDTSLAAALERDRPDLCFSTLHGKEGEDGTVQRLLDLLGIPFVGTAAFDCEIAFDKVLAKDALRRAGVATPDWVTIEGWALRDLGAGASLGRVVERIGLPCVVKPSRSGSALGVGFVDHQEDLAGAVMSALAFSEAAVVERKVEGTEVAAGLAGDPLEPLPLVEIVSRSGIYDYAARYTAGATEYFAPARLSAETAARCVQEAWRAVEALHLLDLTRVDLMIDEAGSPWVLEVNVGPGMTETSLLPMAALSAGMSLVDLCERVVDAAERRAARAPAV